MKKFFGAKIIIGLVLLATATAVFAVETEISYTLLEPGIFGGKLEEAKTFADYASSIFSILLSLTISLAILMIILGGFEYVTSATGAGKSDGKKKIYDALTGLIILFLSYLILYTINPDLVNWKFKVEQLGVTEKDRLQNN